jgi:hypothetical protein
MTDKPNDAGSPLATWSIDPEIVLSRVINAPGQSR